MNSPEGPAAFQPDSSAASPVALDRHSEVAQRGQVALDRRYADVVFFEDATAIDRVIEAEQNSDICAAFFAIMNEEEAPLVYEVLKTY